MTPKQPGLGAPELAVLAFTPTYVTGFAIWFLAAGNSEFVWYVVTLVGFIALVGLTLKTAQYPTAMLWALSLWGLAHMAGGGVPVSESVLYAVQLVPITTPGELTLLKYDQVVHAYGFGVTAWLLWHLMQLHFPGLRGTSTILIYPALGAMGLGAVNEGFFFV